MIKFLRRLFTPYKRDIEMEMSTYEDVQPFIPVIRTGKIVKVYDGDTVTISARIYVTETQTTKLFRFNG